MNWKELDEYSDQELRDEINRRLGAGWKGQCDYCGRTSDTPPCKFPERHAAAAGKKVNTEPRKPVQPPVPQTYKSFDPITPPGWGGDGPW